MAKLFQVKPMNRNYFLVIVCIALGCLFLIFFSLWREIQTPLTKETAITPPLAPYQSSISGVGIVEASSGNIFINTPLQRNVKKILVKPYEKVKKGDILFYLDDSDLRANLTSQEIAYKEALAKLKSLEALPRSEDLSAAEAALKNSKAELDFSNNQREMVLKLPDPRALSLEERNRRLFNYQQAEAKYQQTEANLNKIKAGAWQPDLEIARLGVMQAKASLSRIDTEIQRTIIKSPINGTVLQVKIHEGEFPSTDTLRTPMMILGNTDEMFLRVSINQLDIPNFNPHAPAIAFRQGDAKIEFPLEFVQVEPFLTSKQNLTNGIIEKVDTRVLQIIYRIKKENHPLFVGQQMDVFIESQPSPRD